MSSTFQLDVFRCSGCGAEAQHGLSRCCACGMSFVESPSPEAGTAKAPGRRETSRSRKDPGEARSAREKEKPSTANGQVRFCPKCAQSVDGDWRCCPWCGHDLHTIKSRGKPFRKKKKRAPVDAEILNLLDQLETVPAEPAPARGRPAAPATPTSRRAGPARPSPEAPERPAAPASSTPASPAPRDNERAPPQIRAPSTPASDVPPSEPSVEPPDSAPRSQWPDAADWERLVTTRSTWSPPPAAASRRDPLIDLSDPDVKRKASIVGGVLLVVALFFGWRLLFPKPVHRTVLQPTPAAERASEEPSQNPAGGLGARR